MFEKIKFALKNINYLRAGLWAGIWVALVAFILYVCRANDYVGHTDSGNVVLYPSYFHCVKLFFKLPGTHIWGLLSLVLSYIAGITVELLINVQVEGKTGPIVFGIGLPLVFSILSFYIGIDSRNIDELTHHTVTAKEYEEIKGKHVDYYFHDAFQADSLFTK